MKKILFIFIGVFALAFNLNQTYHCETLGFSIQRNGKILNVPNDIKTNKKMQKDLGKLYEIDFTPLKNSIKVTVNKKNDVLSYIESLKNKKIDVYVTKDKQAVVFVDKDSPQIALKIPADKMVIYYECKKR
jgi:DNA-directed RNA polymerase specialized sigma54-like protein